MVLRLILFSLSLMRPLIEDIVILRVRQEPILLVIRLRNPAQFPHNRRFFIAQFATKIPHNFNFSLHPVRRPVNVSCIVLSGVRNSTCPYGTVFCCAIGITT